MKRRYLTPICATTCAAPAVGLGGNVWAAADAGAQQYLRTPMTDDTGRPLPAAHLTVGENCVFHCPFEVTPIFLRNLGKPTPQNVDLKAVDGAAYQWPGSVGPQLAIVAYSAIRSHQLTYPTRQIDLISYRDQSTARAGRPNMTHCCSEHREYNPAAGAKVMGGPRRSP